MKHLKNITTITGIALATLLFCSCGGDQQATDPTTTPPAETSALPTTLMLSAEPAGDIKTISELKISAKPGDDILIDVYVGGRLKPFVAGRAIMTVVDAKLENACTSDDDHCATPWDYCCAGDDLKGAMATIQVLDENQKTLEASLESANLPAGARAIITGKISNAPAGEALIIDATGIYPKK